MKGLRILAVLLLVAAVVFVMGCERKIVNEVADGENQSLAGCFGCHGEESLDGALLQAEGEWRNSVHASGTAIDYTNRGTCVECHQHQGFLDFIQTGTTDSPYESVAAIHCFTCHAPHTRGDLTVRANGPYALENGETFDHGDANLCANCHHSRDAVEDAVPNEETVQLSTRFGPHHGPQSDLLQGTNGYEDFPGYTYATSTHATQIEEACIGCHMANPNQHDGYDVGGHSWNMRYEAHDGSEYTLVDVCADCHASLDGEDDYDVAETFRDFDGDGEVEGVQTELDDLADSLGVLLAPVRTTGNLFDGDAVVTRGQAGAAWNWVNYMEDRSHGVHNPKYFESLLKASIDYLNDNPIVLPESQEGLMVKSTHR